MGPEEGNQDDQRAGAPLQAQRFWVVQAAEDKVPGRPHGGLQGPRGALHKR